MEKIGIYEIMNVVDGKKYIGSSKNVENRFKQHKGKLNRNVHNNVHLQNAWNKYGEESFVFEVIELCDKNDLLLIEQKHLDSVTDWKEVYNIGKQSSGGDNISNHPNKDMIIKKCTDILLEHNRNLSNNERIKRSERMKGENNINYSAKLNGNKDVGNKISKKLKEFYCENNGHRKGKTNVEIFGEEKAKIVSKKLSKIASERIGSKNPFYNMHHSVNTRERISSNRLGKYFGNQNIKFKIDDTEYSSLGDASKKLGIHITTISFRLKSNNKKFENYKYI